MVCSFVFSVVLPLISLSFVLDNAFFSKSCFFQLFNHVRAVKRLEQDFCGVNDHGFTHKNCIAVFLAKNCHDFLCWF